MSCRCALLESCVSYGESEQAFCEGFALVAERSMLRLYRCTVCSTHWQIDGECRSDFAIKVAQPEHWSSFDDRPYQRDFFIRSHGGESAKGCLWARCPQSPQ